VNYNLKEVYIMFDEEQKRGALRILTGLLFLLPGLAVITNVAGFAGMLSGMGWPAATALAWIAVLVEVIGGLALVAGYQTKYASYGLFALLAVATIFVVIPTVGFDAVSLSNLFFHLIGLTVLCSFSSGDNNGAWSMQ